MWNTKMTRKNERSILLKFPMEIFDEILSYVSPWDIRKLRSVCKLLNEKLNTIYYCQNEIVVWRNICDTRKMVEALSKSNRSLWHLHIEAVYFTDDFVIRFFEKQGRYVNSLSIRNCHFTRGLLEAILFKCDALRSFSFVITEDFNPRDVFDDFSSIESNSAVRSKVTHFKLVIKKMNWLSDSAFCLFFTIFPNIKRLHLEIAMAEVNDRSDPAVNYVTKTPVTYTSVFISILRVRNKLESLSLHVPVAALHIKQEFVLGTMPNLNHLALGCENDDCRNTFKLFSDWSEHFQRIPSFEFFGLYKLPELLTKFQPVQIATIAENFCSYITHQEFTALVKSKLKAIELRLRLKMSVVSVRQANLPINETVKDLNYTYNFPVRSAAVVVFPEYFRGLVHLRLEKVWNALLQTIFQYQVNLRSLYLGDCQLCNTEGFIGNKQGQYSISDLKNLEHLTLLDLRTSVINSRLFKSKFHFPHLKYLNIRCYHKNGRHEMKVPVKLFQPFVNLEALKLSNFSNPSYSALLPLFRKLFRLRYLRCEGFDALNENVTFVDLSEFVFNDINLGAGEDFYDNKLNKIIFMNRWLGFRFLSPKISSFVINWIEF